MPGLVYPVPHVPMLGKGTILVNQFKNPADPLSLTSYLSLGNCIKLEVDLKDDIAELYQSINKNVSLIASALKKRQPNLVIEGTEFDAAHMALAMMAGSLTTLTQTVQTVVAEPLASATAQKKGMYFQTLIGNLDVSLPANTVVHQGGTPLVAGVDYQIADPVMGLIYFPLLGAVSEATAVTIDYKTLAATVPQVNAATLPYIAGRVLFDPDPTDGQKIGLSIWNVRLNPSTPLGMIADDYAKWSMKGMILDDSANHPDCPYWQATFY